MDKIAIGKMIRAERKFGSAEELREQIERDRAAAREWLAGNCQ